MNNLEKVKMMTNVGLAGEDLKPGMVKTVHLARNGIFETKSGSWMGSYTRKASDYVLNASELLDVMEDTFTLTDKLERLPLEAFAATYHFYKHVCDLNGCEAQINFYINEKGLEEITVDGVVHVIKDIPGVDYWSEKVLSYVPVQTNSGGLTSTKDPIYLELRKTMRPFIETHSHNTMGAFKSGTDKANSEIEGLQLVFGKLNLTTYDFKSWVTISGEQFDDVEYDELLKFIDMPEEIGNIEQLGTFEIPEAWMGQCTFNTYVAPTYARNYYAGHGVGYSKRNRKNRGKGRFNGTFPLWADEIDGYEDTHEPNMLGGSFEDEDFKVEYGSEALDYETAYMGHDYGVGDYPSDEEYYSVDEGYTKPTTHFPSFGYHNEYMSAQDYLDPSYSPAKVKSYDYLGREIAEDEDEMTDEELNARMIKFAEEKKLPIRTIEKTPAQTFPKINETSKASLIKPSVPVKKYVQIDEDAELSPAQKAMKAHVSRAQIKLVTDAQKPDEPTPFWGRLTGSRSRKK